MRIPPSETPFREALTRILRPLLRAMIARGLRFPELADQLKQLYVESATRHFALAGKRMTDSRISLLTGLQRKDVRALRERVETGAEEPAGAGLLPRLLARWTGATPYAEEPGAPRTLPRSAAAGPSFEALAAEVSRDVHPRTLLDELIRLRLVRHEPGDDSVTLTSAAFLPARDEAALASYLGANLGDHAEAAIANLDAAPEAGPYFERAVHYNRLSRAALDELEALAREIQEEALARLNARALALQDRDLRNVHASGRFRCGAYIYRDCQDAEDQTAEADE